LKTIVLHAHGVGSLQRNHIFDRINRKDFELVNIIYSVAGSLVFWVHTKKYHFAWGSQKKRPLRRSTSFWPFAGIDSSADRAGDVPFDRYSCGFEFDTFLTYSHMQP
jgi:hypothetical protein